MAEVARECAPRPRVGLGADQQPVAAAGVLENDSDPDGDALIAILAGGPKKGSLDLESDGSFTYKAKKKARGKDSFTYLAEDASGLNSLTTVDIQVKAKKHKKRRK